MFVTSTLVDKDERLRFLCERASNGRLQGKYQYAWGGSEFVLMYEDEVFVPDYSLQGTRGWVLNEEDLIYVLNGGR